MRVEEGKWKREEESEGNVDWTKMNDIDTRSARLAVFFENAQSHSCK